MRARDHICRPSVWIAAWHETLRQAAVRDAGKKVEFSTLKLGTVVRLTAR